MTPWPPDQIITLRALYPHAPWDVVLDALPHSQGAIVAKAHRLGLARFRGGRQSPFPVIRELRSIRREKRLHAEKLASKIGITRTQIPQWEGGHTVPRLRNFFDWVEALDLKIELVPRTNAQKVRAQA